MRSDSRQQALDALAAALAADSDGNLQSNRTTTLIINPDIGCVGWAMKVHGAFLDALDVKLTPRTKGGVSTKEWTSGATFCFSAGDIIHENREQPRCLWQIHSARSAAPRQTLKGVETVPRIDGEVLYWVYDTTGKFPVKTSSERVTQDEFIRRLIGTPLES